MCNYFKIREGENIFRMTVEDVMQFLLLLLVRNQPSSLTQYERLFNLFVCS